MSPRRVNHAEVFLTAVVLLVQVIAAGHVTVVGQRRPSLFDDPRLHEWADLFRKGDPALGARLEADLASAAPHPFAAHAWVVLHSSRGDTASALRSARPEVRMRVERLTTIQELFAQYRYRELLERFPVDAVATASTEPWTAIYLAWAALEEAMPGLSADYALIAVRLQPGMFRPVWLLLDSANADERVRRRLAGSLPSDPSLARSRAFLEPLLRSGDASGSARLQAVERWLVSDPDDADAIRFRAGERAARSDALADYLRAADAYPFLPSAADVLRLMVADKRLADAQEWIRVLSSTFTSSEPDARLWAANRLAAALLAAGDKDGAATLLAGDWPGGIPRESALRHYRLADVAEKKGYLDEALAELEQALKLSPLDRDYCEQRVRLLALNGRHKDALTYATQAETGGCVSPSLFEEAASSARAAGLRDDERSWLDKGVTAYPDHTGLRRALARGYESEGRYALAEPEARTALAISASSEDLTTLASLVRRQRGLQEALRDVERTVTASPSAAAYAPLALPAPTTPVKGRPELQPAEPPRLVTQLGHAAGITAVDFSADGRLLATGDQLGTLCLWDNESGEELRQLSTGSGRIVALSFTADSRVVAAVSEDRSVQQFRVETGERLGAGWQASVVPTAAAVLPNSEGLILSGAVPSGTTGVNPGTSARDLATGRALTALMPADSRVWQAVSVAAEAPVVLGGSSARVSVSVPGLGPEFNRTLNRPAAAVATSTDGRLGALASGRSVTVIDVATGTGLGSAESADAVVALQFVRSEPTLVIVPRTGPVTLWNLDTDSRQELPVAGPAAPARVAAVGRRGRRTLLAVGAADGRVRRWDIADRQPLATLEGRASAVRAVAVSPEGRFLAAGSSIGAVHLWDTLAGREISRAVLNGADGGRTAGTRAPAPSPAVTALLFMDEQTLLVGDSEGAVRVLKVGEESFEPLIPAAAIAAPVARLELARERLLVTREISTVYSLSREPLRVTVVIQATTTSTAWVGASALSRDGRVLAVPGTPNAYGATENLYRVEEGPTPPISLTHDSDVRSVAISDDGRLVATATLDNLLQVWAVDHPERPSITRPWNVAALSFIPGTRILALAVESMGLVTWNPDDPEAAPSTVFQETVQRFTVSPDGRYALIEAVTSGASGERRQVRSVPLGPVTGPVPGYAFDVPAAAAPVPAMFTSDSRFVVAGAEDGTVHVIDVASGSDQCSLISFRSGGADAGDGWAVVAKAGNYDAADPSRTSGLHWAVGSEVIDLAQFKDLYYEPAMLAKVFAGQPLRDVRDVASVGLFPSVEFDEMPQTSTMLRATLRNRGGGIGRVRVLVNGKELPQERLTRESDDPFAAATRLTIDLTAAPLIPASSGLDGRTAQNTVQVIAWNATNAVASRGVQPASWTPPQTTTTQDPQFYAIVAGISQYASPSLRLRFAAKDANDIAQVLARAAGRLYGAGRVHITLLRSEEPGFTSAPDEGIRVLAPSKANFERAFADAREAKPWDTFIVYLAGHGVAVRGSGQQGETDTYAYLTQEAVGANLALPAVRRISSVTSDELVDWVTRVPAVRQAMILDTCAAGAVLGSLAAAGRDSSVDERRALELLKDRTGFWVLMGSAADAVSYESGKYDQGLLTYALLEGLKYGTALTQGGSVADFVDVSAWFNVAASRVPDLARESFGRSQDPHVHIGYGNSFPLGRLSREDLASIALAGERPQLLKPRFIELSERFDRRELGSRVRKRLMQMLNVQDRTNSTGLKARYLDADVDQFPQGLLVTGTYSIDASRVVVDAVLVQNGKRITQFTMSGAVGDMENIAECVAARAVAAASNEPLSNLSRCME